MGKRIRIGRSEQWLSESERVERLFLESFKENTKDPLEELLIIPKSRRKEVVGAIRSALSDVYALGFERGGVQRREFEEMKREVRILEGALKRRGIDAEAISVYSMLSHEEIQKIKFKHRIREEMVKKEGACICNNCGHPIDEFKEYGWLHINGENVERKCVEKLCRNLHKSGTKDCRCDNPEPKATNNVQVKP